MADPTDRAALEGMQVPDLEQEVSRLGLTVEGTGSGGKVVKNDLIEALLAASNIAIPGDTSGRPGLAEVAADRAANRNERDKSALSEEV